MLGTSVVECPEVLQQWLILYHFLRRHRRSCYVGYYDRFTSLVTSSRLVSVHEIPKYRNTAKTVTGPTEPKRLQQGHARPGPAEPGWAGPSRAQAGSAGSGQAGSIRPNRAETRPGLAGLGWPWRLGWAWRLDWPWGLDWPWRLDWPWGLDWPGPGVLEARKAGKFQPLRKLFENRNRCVSVMAPWRKFRRTGIGNEI